MDCHFNQRIRSIDALALSLIVLAMTLFSPPVLAAGKLADLRQAVDDTASENEAVPVSEVSPKSSRSVSGQLDQVRSHVRSPRRRSQTHRHCHRPHQDYGRFTGAWFDVAPNYSYQTIYVAPWSVSPPMAETVIVVPRALGEASQEEPALPDQLETNGMSGGLANDPGKHPLKSWSARVRLESGTDFAGLDRRAIQFLWEGAQGWGVDFQWNSLTEELHSHVQDALHLGQANLLYRIADSEYTQCRIGAGINWLGDSFGVDPGINFTFNADLFPIKPFIVSTDIDFGTLGDSEMFHSAVTVGVAIRRLEIFGGYDYCNVGGTELRGPMIGLRCWF